MTISRNVAQIYSLAGTNRLVILWRIVE